MDILANAMTLIQTSLNGLLKKSKNKDKRVRETEENCMDRRRDINIKPNFL